MKKIALTLLSFFLYAPLAHAAYTTGDVFCATGFGNASFNGEYTYDFTATHYFFTNGTYWMFVPSNSETGYGQMTAFPDDAHGQAYGNPGAGLVGLSWTNDGGTGATNPPGETVMASCSPGPDPDPEPGEFTMGTTTTIEGHLGNITFGLAIIIAMLTIALSGFVWSSVNKQNK